MYVFGTTYSASYNTHHIVLYTFDLAGHFLNGSDYLRYNFDNNSAIKLFWGPGNSSLYAIGSITPNGGATFQAYIGEITLDGSLLWYNLTSTQGMDTWEFYTDLAIIPTTSELLVSGFFYGNSSNVYSVFPFILL